MSFITTYFRLQFADVSSVSFNVMQYPMHDGELSVTIIRMCAALILDRNLCMNFVLGPGVHRYSRNVHHLYFGGETEPCLWN
jgi:hypothetical protein